MRLLMNAELSTSYTEWKKIYDGHKCIAMTVVSLLTGASLWEAGLVALIEPSINGVWFYVLHSTWKKLYDK